MVSVGVSNVFICVSLTRSQDVSVRHFISSLRLFGLLLYFQFNDGNYNHMNNKQLNIKNQNARNPKNAKDI